MCMCRERERERERERYSKKADCSTVVADMFANYATVALTLGVFLCVIHVRASLCNGND